MGAVFGLPVARAVEWPDALRHISGAGFEVVALTPGPEAEDLAGIRAERPAILAGAEGPGLSGAALAAADRRARIPMSGGMDSLNVGHAVAIACHHLVTADQSSR